MHRNAMLARMKEGWFERLSAAISEDPRSMRALSLEAGLGPNFISQMLNEGKDPGGDKLVSILSVTDRSAFAFVFLGLKITAEDLEMLQRFSDLPPQTRDHFRGLLDSLPRDAEIPAP